MWVHGMGFPKSHDIAKAIDKSNGSWRGRSTDKSTEKNRAMQGANYVRVPKGEPICSHAHQWNGWGTALKPGWEPVLVCRKPIAAGMTVAGNVVEHGCGALNIDGCRIPMGAEYDPTKIQRQQRANGSVQFGSSGLIGTEIPMELNVTQEEQRVDIEEMRDSLRVAVAQYAQAIPALAAQGQDPSQIVSRIAEVIKGRQKGLQLETIVEKEQMESVYLAGESKDKQYYNETFKNLEQ